MEARSIAGLPNAGMNTLELRVSRANANAAALADFLGEHPGVRRVFYPVAPIIPITRWHAGSSVSTAATW